MHMYIDHKRTPWCDIFSSVIGAAYHCRGETGRKRMKVNESNHGMKEKSETRAD